MNNKKLKPLTVHQIYEIAKKYHRYYGKKDLILGDAVEKVVRWAEKAHGIVEDNDE